MRLDIVINFGYRYIVICQKCCLFLVLKDALQLRDVILRIYQTVPADHICLYSLRHYILIIDDYL